MQGGAAGAVALERGEQAILEAEHGVGSGRCMKPAHELAGRFALAAGAGALERAEGVLELVAVAPLFDRGHDRGKLEAVQAADPAQRLIDLRALDLELALVGDHLPGDAGMLGRGGDPLGALLEHLEHARVGVAALALVHERTHAVAGNGAGDEHHVPALAHARDALAPAPGGERGDLKLDDVTGRGLHAGSTSSSSRAFCAWRRFSAWSQMRSRPP